jgi:hypothetical protein
LVGFFMLFRLFGFANKLQIATTGSAPI